MAYLIAELVGAARGELVAAAQEIGRTLESLDDAPESGDGCVQRGCGCC